MMVRAGRPNDRPSRLFWIALSFTMILGVILRLYGLTRQSLWLDEANGVRIAQKSFGEIITELKSDVSPPLHYFMLHIWMNIFGSGELSVRAFASIFGILLIPVIYYVGSYLFNRKVGLISAFITSIAEFHIRYSQEVRMYSMLALLGLISIYFLHRSLTTDKFVSWVGYTICTLLTIYTHNYGIFVVVSGVVFFIIYAITHGISPKKFLIAQCVSATLYLPWLPILVTKQYGSSAIVGWIPQMRPYHIYETFRVYSGLVFDVFKPAINNLAITIGTVIFICCFLIGMLSIRKYRSIVVPYIQNNDGLILLLCYLFVTLAIPMLVSIRKPIYLPSRYSISAWPAFPLILGLGVSKIKRGYILLPVLTFILLVSSISLYWYHFIWVKSHDRAIANFIESRANKDDLLVFVPSWASIPIDYYLRIPFPQLGYPWRSEGEPMEVTETEEFPRSPEIMVDMARSKAKSSQGRIFLIYQETVTWVSDIQIVKKTFEENFARIESKKYGDIELTIYKLSLN